MGGAQPTGFRRDTTEPPAHRIGEITRARYAHHGAAAACSPSPTSTATPRKPITKPSAVERLRASPLINSVPKPAIQKTEAATSKPARFDEIGRASCGEGVCQ